jgi:tight adherence protein C
VTLLLAVASLVTASVAIRRWRAARRETVLRRRAAAQMPDLIDLVIVAVRSGRAPPTAVRLAAEWAPEPLASSTRAVVRLFDAGERFADALADLRRSVGPAADPLVDALTAADRDGLAVVPTLDRLADEARRQRRRHADADARSLPIRLGFPLACCTLPSFVLLTVVPVLAGTLSSLRLTLP